MTPGELRELIDDPSRRREATATEAAEAFLARIESEQPRLRALITVTPDGALADAGRVDEARSRGTPLPLDGMPVVVKDIVDVAGVPTTMGSRAFAGRVAAKDAPVVARLRTAGAVLLGTANLHELAYGGTSRNETFGAVVNPWDPAVVPGGSSGGSAAAVAADLCVGAIGSDTGGSIRIPASCCGVAGIRPTYGAVSTRGVFPVSGTLDTVGPLARSVRDVAALLHVMAGFDQHDPRAVEGTFLPPLDGARADVSGLRIGLPRGFFFDAVDDEVAAAVEAAATQLAALGAAVTDVDLPGGETAAAACGPIIWADALSVHRDRLAETPELLEEGTRRRLALAADMSAAELAVCHRRMFEWQRDVRLAFEQVDLLLTPTLPAPPPPSAGADTVDTTARVVPFTFAMSLARVPAVSIPCGFTRAGHPIGAQLAAPWWRDAVALEAAAAYQEATDWHLRRPA